MTVAINILFSFFAKLFLSIYRAICFKNTRTCINNTAFSNLNGRGALFRTNMARRLWNFMTISSFYHDICHSTCIFHCSRWSIRKIRTNNTKNLIWRKFWWMYFHQNESRIKNFIFFTIFELMNVVVKIFTIRRTVGCSEHSFFTCFENFFSFKVKLYNIINLNWSKTYFICIFSLFTLIYSFLPVTSVITARSSSTKRCR